MTPSGDPGPPDVVVVGAASRDIAAADPRGWRLGGGVSYSALTTARLGLRTAALIGLDGPAESATELEMLRDAEVMIEPVRLAHGPVFDNIETASGRVQLCFDRSDPIPVAALPAAWLRAKSWILAPVAAELPDAWAATIPDRVPVAVGWQGLLRELEPGARVRHARPGPSPIVERADMVGVSRDDLEQDASLADLCAFLHPGARLVMTQGADGGLVLSRDGEGRVSTRRYPAVHAPNIVDATGAGDVFLAALLAAQAEPRLVGGRLDRGFDLLLAAAVASLVLEGVGMHGVPERDAVRRRIGEARQPV